MREDGVYWISLRGSLPLIAEWNGENWYVIGDWRELRHDDVKVISDKLQPPPVTDEADGVSDDVNEWVDITTLAATHQTQLNTATGEIRHRRPRVHIDFSGYPPEVIAAMAVEDAWLPGHPPD